MRVFALFLFTKPRKCDKINTVKFSLGGHYGKNEKNRTNMG